MTARSKSVLMVGLWLTATAPLAAEEIKVLELRLQQAGEMTYFHVRMDPPKDLQIGTPAGQFFETLRIQQFTALRQARLIPQDGKTVLVYRRPGEEWQRNLNVVNPGMVPTAPAAPTPVREAQPQAQPNPQVPVQGLEFIGKVKAAEKAQFVLLYPWVEEKQVPQQDGPAKTYRKRGWKEVPVTLDLTTAAKVAVPSVAAQRQPTAWPVRDDLEGLWAVAQGEHFLGLESSVTDFGYYSFARLANSRKYGVPTLRDPVSNGIAPERHDEFLNPRLYEMTTGAEALAESLAQRRMLGQGGKMEDRTVRVGSLAGIDIAEHPWEKMMAGKKPADEPLARCIPHDQYYVRFQTFQAFLDTSDLFNDWGSAVTQFYEVKSRDSRLKERYEKQLCLRSTLLGRTLGPAVIRSLAFTGGDMYLREGSDLAILFDVVNDKLFLNAVAPFLAEARKEFGSRLVESQSAHGGVTIESFVTPDRVVSLHRATLGKVVVYANSRIGLQRIIDAQQKKAKCLADSLDFQYMRTVFRADDAEENGFAFFSDAFIRQLVGPASKIKERRRLEAYTSLQMLHHAALYAGSQNGKIPEDLAGLMSGAMLTGKDLLMPEGPPVEWRGQQRQAFSTAYNTMHFLTPLCELPIDKVTPTEQREYEQFRLQYLGLWRQFFDPVGMRLAQKNGKLTLDTYILPLIQSSGYQEMRRLTGDGVLSYDLRSMTPGTIVQFMTHISPNAREREMFSMMLSNMVGGNKATDWLGDWFFVRLEDSPAFAKLAQWVHKYVAEESDSEAAQKEYLELQKTFYEMPLTVGVAIKNPLIFGGLLTTLRTAALNALPGNITWEPLEKKHQDVAIVRIHAKLGNIMGGEMQGVEPSLYYALVDGGFYLSLREDCIHRVIDQAVARRGQKADPTHMVQLNSGVYFSPAAAQSAMQIVQFMIAYQAHERSIENTPLLQPLYEAGVLSVDATAPQQHQAAYQYFGFAPISPDGTAYRYDPRLQEVVNAAHGSLRHDRLPEKPIELPLHRLLAQVQTLRLDLRFREDGVHTTVTMDRSKGK